MSELWLRVDKYLDGDELPGSVYATLSGTAITPPRHFMIPVGSREQWHKETVVPGKYLLQVRLPSGAVVSRDMRVDAGTQDPVRVVVRQEPSAREHLSWPRLLGTVDADLGVEAFTRRERASDVRGAHGVGLTFDLVGNNAGDSVRELRHHQPVRIGQAGLDFPPVSYGMGWPEDHESVVVQFLPILPGMRDDPDAAIGGRLFLRISGLPGPPRFVSLPLPWYAIREEREMPGNDIAPTRLDVLLHWASPDGSPSCSVIVRDAVIGPLLAYLESGQLDVVQEMRDTLLSRAEGMLYHKRTNPYSATAGALVLLKTRSYARLHHWPRNLANWSSWLSDGAVIHAWSCLHGVQNDLERPVPDSAQARSYLLKAATRGVPVFSDCLRLLVDGLKYFAALAESHDDQDHEVEDALLRMRAFAASIDWDQTFTTFAGEDPLTPLAGTGNDDPLR